MMTPMAFWKNSRFAEWEISSACVDTKQRGIEATCVISGDGGQPRENSHSLCELSPVNDTLGVLVYEHVQQWS